VIIIIIIKSESHSNIIVNRLQDCRLVAINRDLQNISVRFRTNRKVIFDSKMTTVRFWIGTHMDVQVPIYLHILASAHGLVGQSVFHWKCIGLWYWHHVSSW